MANQEPPVTWRERLVSLALIGLMVLCVAGSGSR